MGKPKKTGATGSKSAGPKTPDRKPVGKHEHPLGEAASPETPDSYTHVKSPSSPLRAAEASPTQKSPPRVETVETVEDEDDDDDESHREAAAPREKKVSSTTSTAKKPLTVETVEGEDDDSDDGVRKEENLSGIDEALTDDELTYASASSEFGPPNLQNLIQMTPSLCRVACRVTTRSGAKVGAYCGKKIQDCKVHAGPRLNGAFRVAPGYLKSVPAKRGFQGHGLASGPNYTESDMTKFLQEEQEETERFVEVINTDPDRSSELEDLVTDLLPQVSFDPKVQVLGGRQTSTKKNDSKVEKLRKILAANTKSDLNKAVPPLQFGLISTTGRRWVTGNAQKANAAFDLTGSRIQGVFHTQEEAHQWKAAGDPPAPDPPSSSSEDESSESDSDSEPQSCHRKTQSKKSMPSKRNKKKLEKTRQKTAHRKNNVENTSPDLREELQDIKQQLADCQTKLRGKQKGRKPRDSSESGSDDSSDPSSSSSSNSDPSSTDTMSSDEDSLHSHGVQCRCHECRRTKKRQRKKERTRKHKNRTKKGKRCYCIEDTAKYRLEDTSKGTKDKVFGLSINGTKIDKEIAPADLKTKEQSEFYNAAVDVTSLPGGWNPQKGKGLQDEILFNESQKVASLAATILAASTKVRSNMEIRNTSYNSLTRHSMGRIKDRDGLFEFVGKLAKSRESAFQQQDNLIQQFMYARHYDEAFTTEYLQNGLLPRLIRLTFENFYELANAIRQLAFDHPNWDAGPSKAMLEHHADKIWNIREMAITRKQLILQTYVYLRDAQAKGFYHESMSEALWRRLEDVSKPLPKGSAGGAGGTPAETKCGHCGTKELHRLVNKPGQKRYCPVKSLTEANKAKEAAKWVVEQKLADPEKDTQEVIAAAIEQFK